MYLRIMSALVYAGGISVYQPEVEKEAEEAPHAELLAAALAENFYPRP